jgi:predicted CoA-substrate-specific enzyme activase
MSYVGINIGALTVKVVAVQAGVHNAALSVQDSAVVAHQGRPMEVLQRLLAGPEFAAAEYFGVSGHLGHITEFAAIQRALREVRKRALREAGESAPERARENTPGDFDAVVSLGGESFLVYTLAAGKVTNVLSHNKCAAGSGEFFMQLIGRMGLDIDAAIELSSSGTVVPLASRCTVHCKSDVTHKLNRHEATPADILKTLHDSMAGKVVALLEKGQNRLRRVLLIGGVTRNAALLDALRAKLPETDLIALPESPWFEAWGTALLTGDNPLYKTPRIAHPPVFETLPSLDRFPALVMEASPLQPPPEGAMVLGVDAGSTTTKAVLLDPATRAIVASHYARTHDDPVAAVRECLKELIGHVGNRPVSLVSTTGSARELIGAWLGTEQVFNEISAHAAGATHFAADVDTIFEIGGQDAKYIYLRNGVPIGYAMNNACSAGTGSFLEESAQSDLGVRVSEIAEIALTAPAPVKFKTTCAAFINSDIRIAQQQGQSRDNILAGLVYAIVENYLTKVKGQRPVGKKVLLQGGVALNRAVGHAFAQRVGRPVLIPSNPELLGALGVGLLALDRCGEAMGAVTDLETLAAAKMSLVGRFTCRACKMNCSIERFEVDGRKFPFGGRCSLYENVWKRKTRTAPAPDLVEQRSAIVYNSPRHFEIPPTAASKPRPYWDVGPAIEAARSFLEESFGHSNGNGKPVASETRIGIPRALTTHSLFPLYSTFFSALGMEVVLSAVDPRGDLRSHSGFCLPAQIAHGAVLDLAQKQVKLVFLPQVARMAQQDTGKDSYLCPITQAGPYFLAKAFPDTRFLSPVLDFTNPLAASAAMTEMATRELGVSRELANEAWAAAVSEQTRAECALIEMGKQVLAQALAADKPAVLLAGHSYNAYTPEASQSVSKKLSSMGVLVIPADCLMPVGTGATVWYFANQILNAAALSKRHPNLFLLCISNFSCTIDAFTHSLLASELEAKPYLILEIDAHTADAGVQTRLEAFLDIVQNYRAALPSQARPFTSCKLIKGGQVITSTSEAIPLTDPRVKLHMLNFSEFHAQSTAMALNWLGLHSGPLVSIGRSQLDLGLQFTSGRECLPLPLSIGQLLQINRDRQPGEIAGFIMMQGGAPCVSEAYMDYFERFIVEHRLADTFMVHPGPENDYLGFDPFTLLKYFSPAVLLADILVEIDHVLRVVGAAGSLEQFHRAWRRFASSAKTLDDFTEQLPAFVECLAALPRTRDPIECPKVVVTGDFYARFSPFFMDGVRDLYAARGVILKPVDLTDLFLYVTYDGMRGTANNWGLKPGGFALAKACTRVLESDGQQYLQQWWGYQSGRRTEQRYREIFLETGLLISRPNDTVALFEKSSEHVSPQIFGEITPTVGKSLNAEFEGYDGIILIGPFNCLPFRISEAILKPLSIQQGMPLLTYETDGCAVTPAVLRQVDVHIQQVLEHATRIC